MSIAAFFLLIAVILFAIEAVWHRSIVAAGLAFFAASFLVGQIHIG